MNMISIQYYKTPIGELIMGSFENQLCLFDFRYRKMRKIVDNRIKKGLDAKFVEQDDPVLKETRRQFEAYLHRKRKVFSIPLLLVGTDFQKRVWHVLKLIEYGCVSSYAQLAKDIQHQKAIRAVANANGANALCVIIPCHRIVGLDGKLVGYGGGLAVKKKLLDIETLYPE